MITENKGVSANTDAGQQGGPSGQQNDGPSGQHNTGPSGQNPENQIPNDGENQPQIVAAVTSRRFPPFSRTNPRIWFIQVETVFRASRVTNDKTKFVDVVCQLDAEVLAHLEDIFELPDAEQTYGLLKQRLVSQFSDSEAKRLQKLLQELSLEDKRPSNLLREMRTLAGNRVPDDFLKNLWLQRLPSQMQAILAMSNVDLNELANQADRISEVTSGSMLAAVTTTRSPNPSKPDVSDHSDMNNVTKALAELTKTVNNLAKMVTQNKNNEHRSRSKSRENTPQRTPSASVDKSKSGVCYYHSRFGNEATKCKQPCTFKQSKN